MTRGTEEGIDGVTLGSCEVVSLEMAIVFEMSDDRFDRTLRLSRLVR